MCVPALAIMAVCKLKIKGAKSKLSNMEKALDDVPFHALHHNHRGNSYSLLGQAAALIAGA
jgi:hypothetical protein